MSSSAVEVREALATRVEVREDALSVELADGRTIAAPLAWYPRLVHATAEERGRWRLLGGGRGIHWPALDEDVSVANLLAGQPSAESQSSFKKWLAARVKQAAAGEIGLGPSQANDERRKRRHWTHRRGVAYPALSESRIRLQCRSPYGGECTGAPCCLSGTGASPGRRGEDARTPACREFRATACPGGQRSTDPLQTGRSSARLPAPDRQPGLAVASTPGQNRPCRACTKRRSTLPERGHAIG